MKTRNPFGFSLLEVLIAVGLLGIVSAGMAQYMVQMQRSQYMVTAKGSISVFTNSLQNMLNIPQVCSQAFRPPTNTGLNPAFNLALTKTAPGQPISLQLPGGTVVVRAGHREDQFTLRSLFLQSEASAVNLAASGNPNYLVKVMADFDIRNPTDFNSVLSSSRVTLAHLILETDAAGAIQTCRTSVSQEEQLATVCESIAGATFTNGQCTLPAPSNTVTTQQAQSMCVALGGTYGNGSCTMPASGTVTSSSTTTPGDPSTVTPAQLNIICSAMGGAYTNGSCKLATTTSSSTVSLPPTLKGCEAAPPGCGQCQFASCTSTGWACTWDFRGPCMKFWEDDF